MVFVWHKEKLLQEFVMQSGKIDSLKVIPIPPKLDTLDRLPILKKDIQIQNDKIKNSENKLTSSKQTKNLLKELQDSCKELCNVGYYPPQMTEGIDCLDKSKENQILVPAGKDKASFEVETLSKKSFSIVIPNDIASWLGAGECNLHIGSKVIKIMDITTSGFLNSATSHETFVTTLKSSSSPQFF